MNKIYIFFASLIIVILFTFRDTNKILIYQLLINATNTAKKIGINYKRIDIYKAVLKQKNQLLVKKIFYKKINFLWKKDLDNLTKKNVLPKEWRKIKSMEWENKKIAKHLTPPIVLRKAGLYHLKIYTYLLNDDYSALVIQYNLINIQSKNMIWEFSRTFKTKASSSSQPAVL